MLNIKGAYVVIGAKAPIALLLGASTDALFNQRVGVVGAAKATEYTFGHGYTVALPCVRDCMETVALNYEGPHMQQVRAMCARIALGQPLGDPSGSLGDDTDGSGGTRVKASPKPRKPSPANSVALSGVQS